MNLLKAQYLLVLLSACMLTGCGKEAAKTDTEMDKLVASFTSADPDVKSVVDKSVADAKAANYRTAFDDLVPLLKNSKVTPEQIDAIGTAMHQLSLMFPPPNPSGPASMTAKP